MARKHVLQLLGAALAVGAAAFASSAASEADTGRWPTTRTTRTSPTGTGRESDAPGANNWLKKEVAIYEKAHPKVKITVVIQSTDTLTSAFTTASQTKSGPDIATQWATLPTLTPAWNGSSVPISDYVPASETKNWIGTPENMSGGKLWAMPQYLLGIPFVWNKALFKKAGLDPEQGAEDVGGVPRRREEAQGGRDHAVRDGQQGRLRRSLVLLADRQAEPQFDQRAQGRDDRQGQLRRPRSSPASTRRSPI